jgi:uncharacterized protein YodC (DUF2158 family)
VRLKTGGPEMVVSYVFESDNVMKNALLGGAHGLETGDLVCTWFDGKEKKESGFRAGAVVRVDDA